MSSWIEKIIPGMVGSQSRRKSAVPEGLWIQCPKCDSALYRPELDKNLDVCPKCDHHLRISARRRIDVFLDQDNREEIAADLEPTDRLKFKDTKRYKDRLLSNQKKTGEKDALVAFKGELNGLPVVAVAFEFGFLGGSMGSIVGEKFVRAVNVCLEEECPLVCFSASGGARMQEALFSLMQMAKTAAALEVMKYHSIPYISVMTDPVFGGVSASLATLGDLNVAEPNALIGFAGPRVIEQTVRETLPEGFQRSEFLLEHGALDMIIPRVDMRWKIALLLRKMLGLPSAADASEAVEEPVTDDTQAEATEAVSAENKQEPDASIEEQGEQNKAKE